MFLDLDDAEEGGGFFGRPGGEGQRRPDLGKRFGQQRRRPPAEDPPAGGGESDLQPRFHPAAAVRGPVRGEADSAPLQDLLPAGVAPDLPAVPGTAAGSRRLRAGRRLPDPAGEKVGERDPPDPAPGEGRREAGRLCREPQPHRGRRRERIPRRPVEEQRQPAAEVPAALQIPVGRIPPPVEPPAALGEGPTVAPEPVRSRHGSVVLRSEPRHDPAPQRRTVPARFGVESSGDGAPAVAEGGPQAKGMEIIGFSRRDGAPTRFRCGPDPHSGEIALPSAPRRPVVGTAPGSPVEPPDRQRCTCHSTGSRAPCAGVPGTLRRSRRGCGPRSGGRHPAARYFGAGRCRVERHEAVEPVTPTRLHRVVRGEPPGKMSERGAGAAKTLSGGGTGQPGGTRRRQGRRPERSKSRSGRGGARWGPQSKPHIALRSRRHLLRPAESHRVACAGRDGSAPAVPGNAEGAGRSGAARDAILMDSGTGARPADGPSTAARGECPVFRPDAAGTPVERR